MARHLPFAHDKRRRPYWRDPALLGKAYFDKQAQPVLIIGKDTWSRQEMVDDMHCGNFVAAANLSKLAAKLQVDSLEQLVNRFTLEDILQERGIGITTVVVLMQAQEAKKKDPLVWIDRKPNEIVTLTTEQHRARANAEKKREEERIAKRKGTHLVRQPAGAHTATA